MVLLLVEVKGYKYREMVLYSSSTQNPPHWVVTVLCVCGHHVLQAPNMNETGQIPEPGLSGWSLFLAAKL